MTDETIFVTNDSNLNKKREEASEASEAAEKEVTDMMSGGFIELTPDLFKELAEAAAVTVTYFQKQVSEFMTEELAKLAREMRVDVGCTWRAIASEFNAMLNGDWGSNQLMGIAICEAAAKMLGEDPDKEPWN